jgi:hypothetical protein
MRGHTYPMNRILFKSQTVEWRTPSAIYDALNAEFGFTFDPCPMGAEVDGAATLFSEWGGAARVL